VLRHLAQRRSAQGNAIVVPVIDRLRGNPDRRDPRVSKLQFKTLKSGKPAPIMFQGADPGALTHRMEE